MLLTTMFGTYLANTAPPARIPVDPGEDLMTDEQILKNLINQEFTPSEQIAILVQMADAVGDGRKYETYRELRNGKNVLMVRVEQ